jgi:hypothetical protein
VLRHHECHTRPQNTATLFGDVATQPRCLHDSSLRPYAFTRDELNEWCKQAFRGDEAARQRLLRLQDRLEPEWMFWQAEHFAACFLIPRDCVMDYLNAGGEVSNWPALYRLAERFGVSPTMMKKRLVKMGVIVIENNQPKAGGAYFAKLPVFTLIGWQVGPSEDSICRLSGGNLIFHTQKNLISPVYNLMIQGTARASGA